MCYSQQQQILLRILEDNTCFGHMDKTKAIKYMTLETQFAKCTVNTSTRQQEQ
jgi:hypothetical protein